MGANHIVTPAMWMCLRFVKICVKPLHKHCPWNVVKRHAEMWHTVLYALFVCITPLACLERIYFYCVVCFNCLLWRELRKVWMNGCGCGRTLNVLCNVENGQTMSTSVSTLFVYRRFFDVNGLDFEIQVYIMVLRKTWHDWNWMGLANFMTWFTYYARN